MEELSKEELIRYARHLTLPEVGKEGQIRLKNAKVLIVGAGGLGAPAAIYLAAAGIGAIGIVDFDKVDATNLQRQILYTEEDVNKHKATISKDHLKKINNNIKITVYPEKLTSKNALEMIKNYDLVIDGSDNFPTKYLINDACVLLNKPNVYGSVFRFDGHCSVFNYKNGPCYRCLFPDPPPKGEIPNCEEAGVLGVLPGIIGTIQATEAIKIILGKGKILSGKLLVYNAMNMDFQKLDFIKNKNCKVCSKNAAIKGLMDYDEFCSNEIRGNVTDNTKEIEKIHEITVKELKKMIDSKEDFVLVDIREDFEQELCRLDSSILTSFSRFLKGDMLTFDNLDKNKKIILYCHTGNRSAYAIQILKKKGFTDLINLVGGIDAWAKEIDNKIPLY
jgi:sulfur-carrier protein adenylyltransferase/sulfurtransferase